MTWGAEIPVNNCKPDWVIEDDTPVKWRDERGERAISTTARLIWTQTHGDLVAIRLPADHPYYKVQAYNAQHGTNFTCWSGGERAPDDWDGGEVLLRALHREGVTTMCPPVAYWTNNQDTGDVIAYTRRPTVAEHMTEREAREHGADDVVVAAMRTAGILRDETPAERFKNARPDWRLLDRSELIDYVLVWSANQ